MRRLVIALLVVVGVLLVLDYAAAAVAESAVSREMREQLGLDDDPDVRINGFPFLTQALAGEYRSVDVAADQISVGQLRDLEVKAQLREVSAPLSELLGDGPRTLDVAEAEGTVRVTSDDLERLVPQLNRIQIESLDADGLERAVEDGSDPSVLQLDPDSLARIVGTATVEGVETEVAVLAVLELVGEQIQLVPVDVRLGDAGSPSLPAAARAALQEQFTLRISPGSLPLDVTPTNLRVQGGALEISGVARDLTLGAAASSIGG